MRPSFRANRTAAHAQPLPLDHAGAAAFELGDSAELHELGQSLLVPESGEHAREVADRCDGGAAAAAEWFAAGGSAEVRVAARAGRLGDDLDLAVRGLELEHGARDERL